MNLNLKGKTAILLAASKGLGKASALALALEGVNIVICAREQTTLDQAAEEIRKKSKAQVLSIPCDVNNEKQLTNLITQTIKTFGKIDILINNAGGPPPTIFEETTDEQWQKAFEQTLMSAVRTIRLVIPHMKKTGSGRIINMASLSAKQPSANLLLSNSLRAGVLGMAKTLSNELGKDNITVNTILTGYFLTDRLRQTRGIEEKKKQGITEEEAWEEVTNLIPLKRLGKLEEYGALVAFLASEQAGYITGTAIQIDGGLNKSLL